MNRIHTQKYQLDVTDAILVEVGYYTILVGLATFHEAYH